jgi:competence protein ComEA
MRLSVWKKIKSEKRNKTGGLLILLLVVLVCYGLRPVIQRTSEQTLETPCANPVFIEVTGDIRFPGVYTFCHRPVMQELLKRVGKSGSDLHGPNSFKIKTFHSGHKIFIRDDGQRSIVSVMEMSAYSKMTLGLPISLNRENEVGLTALPGIGSFLAHAIVRERQNRGGFKSLDELRDIKGIGEKILEKIRPFLVV